MRAIPLVCEIISHRVAPKVISSLSLQDWASVLQVALQQNVAPLLYWTICNSDLSDFLPTEIRIVLKKVYYYSLANNLVLFKALGQIIENLAQEHIPVMVLKGGALAQTIYPDPGVRPMADLDIVIPKEDFKRAVSLLYEMGYIKYGPPAPSQWLAPWLYYDLKLKGGGYETIALEVHWNILAGDADWRNPPIVWFWEQTEQVHIPNQTPLTILSPTAQLMYLSSHQVLKHGNAETSLLWVYDLHLLWKLQQTRIDLAMLCRMSRSFHWGYAIAKALRTTQDMFGTSIPATLLDDLERGVPQFEKRLVEKLESDMNRVEKGFLMVSSLNWRARLVILITRLFPSHEFMGWKYTIKPVWLLPLFYPYRWVSLIYEILFCMIIRKK